MHRLASLQCLSSTLLHAQQCRGRSVCALRAPHTTLLETTTPATNQIERFAESFQHVHQGDMPKQRVDVFHEDSDSFIWTDAKTQQFILSLIAVSFTAMILSIIFILQILPWFLRRYCRSVNKRRCERFLLLARSVTWILRTVTSSRRQSSVTTIAIVNSTTLHATSEFFFQKRKKASQNSSLVPIKQKWAFFIFKSLFQS